MFDAYQRTLAEVEELNMIPVMNLFIVLIPFLLATAAFYQVAVIPTSTPQQVAQPAGDEATDAVMVNLVIAADGALTLSATGGDGDEAKLAALGAELPPVGGAPDVAGLQARLAALKAEYPASETAFILPADSVGVQTLVEVIDGVRERAGAGDAMESLFPVTVLSQFIAPVAGEAGAVDVELSPEGEEPLELLPEPAEGGP
ncbi:MAG: biopolymer transporter ExbD [Deltaproteobacteria bacterium]|nr:biopolymer transporter ExbD [Deltaproteobacteria bacterium]MCB9786084.1 biopolymer transporter ExbD [Deltaproteobacteria bacterium]